MFFQCNALDTAAGLRAPYQMPVSAMETLLVDSTLVRTRTVQGDDRVMRPLVAGDFFISFGNWNLLAAIDDEFGPNVTTWTNLHSNDVYI